MTNETAIYGKSSYEYAIGCFKATHLQPLSEEKITRINDSDMPTALRLLSECGYPPVTDSGEVTEAIETGMAEASAFIRLNSPDRKLTDLLFFEEDALNLKIYLKSLRNGVPADTFTMKEGGIDREILRICAETGDYSLIGADVDAMLSELDKVEDPGKLSCLVDSAIFAHSLAMAEKSGCKSLVKLFTEYGIGRNRLTALRLKNLGRNADDYSYAFLPIKGKHEIPVDTNKSASQILAETAKSFGEVIEELDSDEGMGFIARYYFIKKNEASRLRLIFAEKNLGNGGNANE